MAIKNLVFFGEDAFSCVILQSLINTKYNIKVVVTPYYENYIYKRLEVICNQNKIKFIRTKAINSPEIENIIKSANPDLGVIAHFERLIKRTLIEIPTHGFINVHPSLLPYYRGMSPQHWPLINEEPESGITVHFVDETADTGDIILQRRFALNTDMYVSDLQKIWLQEYKTLVPEAITLIEQGASTIKQHDLKGSYYGKLKDEQCIINNDYTVRQAYNLIRGVSLPYQGASYNNIKIFKAHII
ncbi:hypothetical protein I6E10_14230, partial [Phocaeicola barnesiae]|uniref:methionyl-tRNA formyltransferase n=1 Tax=Phocaeicola barnesiae TaxID=376804 RepID=UPI001F42E816